MALNDAMLQKFVDDALAASQPKFGDVSSPMLADAGVTMPTSSSGRLSTGSSMPRQQMPSVASLTMNPYSGPGTPSKQVDPKKAFWMGTLADVADSMGGTGPAQFQRGAQQQQYAQAQNRGQLPGQVAQRKMQYDQWEKQQANRRQEEQLTLQKDKAAADRNALDLENREKEMGERNFTTLYEQALGGGHFTGTKDEMRMLDKSDLSDLTLAVSKSRPGARKWTPEDLRQEFKAEEFTDDSWTNAERYGDAALLVPKVASWNVNKEQISEERSLRAEYEKEMKPIRSVQEMFTKTLVALEQGSGAGDLASIFTFMKTLDPPSTVREGEFALAAQVAGVKERILNLGEQFEGKILPPAAREQLAGMVTELVGLTRGRYDQIQEDYGYRVDSTSLDKRRVMGTSAFDYDNLHKFTPKAADPATAPASRGDRILQEVTAGMDELWERWK